MITNELIIDSFAGGGGASTGIENAIGRPVDIAINHDPDAIFMHARNHPQTLHLTEDVWQVDIKKVVGDRPVGLLWASPDCTHHSRAKGGKPVSNERRGLAEVIINWAIDIKPRIICLENVPEFQDWGPVKKNGRIVKAKKKKFFRKWVKNLYKAGYHKIDYKVLDASEFGVPTSRKRLYLIARRDGLPVSWPVKTHGPGLLPYKSAAECIDWSLKGQSIFMSKKDATALRKSEGTICRRPLSEKTMRRIALGVKKYVLDNPEPFVIAIDHGSSNKQAWPISEPLKTITCENRFAAIVPFLTKYHGQTTENSSRCYEIPKPLHTVDTSNRFGLVSTFLTKFYSTNIGSGSKEPVPTITTTGNHLGQVSAFLLKYYSTNIGSDINNPCHTVTTKPRFGLVQIEGIDYQIVDITLRMLAPHELAAAQGFPKSYILTGNKGNQIAKIGNSVCPPMAELIVKANYLDVKKAVA